MKRFFALLWLTLTIPVVLPALAMAATDAERDTTSYQTSAGSGAR